MAKDPEAISRQFVADLEASWGEHLASVVLYGSAVRDDYVPGRSDLNFLVLAEQMGPGELALLRPFAKRWRQARIAWPVFMRPAMVATALDSYPLEFLTMKASYRVLAGSDPLADLTFRREDVRLECERELRGKLLLLRAGSVDCEGKADRMAALIRDSIGALTAIFQGLLFVAERPYAVWGNDLLEAGRDAFGLDAVLFHRLGLVRFEKRLPGRVELAELLGGYLLEVERLVDWVDAGGLREAQAQS